MCTEISGLVRYGKCPGSPVIEKLIENMWSIYGTHIVIRVRGHFDVTNEVVPRKYISFRLCVKIHRDLYMKTKAFFYFMGHIVKSM